MESRIKKILLVGNYLSDRQQSMLRFGEMLYDALSERGWTVERLQPEPRFLNLSRAKSSQRGLVKWLGYLDKYVVFPRRLYTHVAKVQPAVVHILDHSNSMYVPRQSATPWVVTCHDLLAVRGALGENTYCPATWSGRRLQASICRGLGRAWGVASVSGSTQADLNRIVKPTRLQQRLIVYNAQNYPYKRISVDEAHRRLKDVISVPWKTPYIIHVGQSHPRKNRGGILNILSKLKTSWGGNIVFCGMPLTEKLKKQIVNLQLTDRVFEVQGLTGKQLEAAYNLAHVMLFPSICEGFGWPIIEAQACGCPVICSDTTSLPEIAGEGGLVHGLYDENAMAKSVINLEDPRFREKVIASGLKNIERFTMDSMLDGYEDLYERVLNAKNEFKVTY